MVRDVYWPTFPAWSSVLRVVEVQALSINAVRDFQVTLRRVVVRDKASVVAPERERGMLADIPRAVQ